MSRILKDIFILAAALLLILCAAFFFKEGMFFQKRQTSETELESESAPITESDKDSLFHITDAGSEELQVLKEKCVNSQSAPSVSGTTFNIYRMETGEQVANMYFESVADQTPEIYLYDGNIQYETGKCSNVWGIYAESKADLVIRDCVFSNMSGVLLLYCGNILIENCYFSGCENGVYLLGCENVTIRNCTFDMNSTGLVNYYQGVYAANGNYDITIEKCRFSADNIIHKPFRVGKFNEDDCSENILFDQCEVSGCFMTCFQNIKSKNTVLNQCAFYLEKTEGEEAPFIVENTSEGCTARNCCFYADYQKERGDVTCYEDCSFVCE